jgi:type I restriction enzyme S subunit
VDIASVDNIQKRITQPKQLLGQDAPSRARKVIRTNDVIVSMTRPNLNAVALVPPELDCQICSTGFAVLRANGRTLPEYLFHFVTSRRFVDEVSGAVSGAMYPATSESKIKSIEIPLPPLPEQRRIVDILNRANGIRRLRKEAQAKARQIIPALFAEMFGDPVSNPKGWPVASFGELISDGPQNGLYRSKSDYGSGTPIVRINSFYDGRLSDVSTFQRVRLGRRSIDKYELHEGDILVNRVNSRPFLGKSALVPSLSEPVVFESNMMRLKVKNVCISPSYLIQLLQSKTVRNRLLSGAKDAVNQSSINQSDVKGLPIIVPPLELQQKFIARARAVAGISDEQARSLAATEDLSTSLMNNLFQERALC